MGTPSKKKKLSYEEKAKKKFGVVDEKEYFEKAMSRKSLPQPEIKKLRGVLELYQLAWVLNPTSENLQKIVYFYLLLGDENKAVTLINVNRGKRASRISNRFFI